jgi:hypothetical protein
MAITQRITYFGVAALIVVLGLAIRHAGLPWVFAKYGGSGLWGMMIYFVLACLLPKAPILHKAILACFLVTLVELSRLYHVPWLDDFRTTTAGAILLGRFFSVGNILAYWIGIACGAALDRAGLRK